MRTYTPRSTDVTLHTKSNVLTANLLPTMDWSHDKEACNFKETDYVTIQQTKKLPTYSRSHPSNLPVFWFHKQSGSSESTDTPRSEECDIELSCWMKVEFGLSKYNETWHELDLRGAHKMVLPTTTYESTTHLLRYKVSGSYNV